MRKKKVSRASLTPLDAKHGAFFTFERFRGREVREPCVFTFPSLSFGGTVCGFERGGERQRERFEMT